MRNKGGELCLVATSRVLRYREMGRLCGRLGVGQIPAVMQGRLQETAAINNQH